MKYRYPPFDQGERLAKQKSHQKETQKQCEKKNQSLYIGSPNSIKSFSTEKLSNFQTMSIYLKNIVILWILNIKGPIRIHMFHNKLTTPS
jgi:hypothetical protein